ncbi:hypothetical protein C8F01DRAFT_1360477 [Mycena amicta]|nr:hypothetical protein C8F01DRAFT_1360477 [Mycena amicta]
MSLDTLAGRKRKRERLSEIENDMEELQSEYEEILYALRAAEVQRNRIYGPSRLRNLPDEMLLEIFRNFLPPYPDVPPRTGMGSPSHLMLVCQHWHDIVVNTPTFWRAIHIEDDWTHEDSDGLRRLQEKTETWLERSGNCSLSIQINVVANVENHEYILEVFLPHRARWEYLEVGVMAQDWENLVGAVPNLRELALRFSSPPIIPSFPIVALMGLAGYTIPAIDNLPWHQVTSLTLNDTVAVSLLNRISLDNLVHCRLIASDAVPDDEPLKTLPRLETFILEQPFWTDEPQPQGYLQTFVTPSLRQLHVPEAFLSAEPVRSLERFILQSKCTLKELCITGALIHADEQKYRSAEAFRAVRISFDLTKCEWDDPLYGSWVRA